VSARCCPAPKRRRQGRRRLFLAFAALAIAAAVAGALRPARDQLSRGEQAGAPAVAPTRNFSSAPPITARDVLSQLLVGARVSLVVGILSAFIIVFVGTNVGLVSGYFGGWVDAVLMRITDIAFGVPFLPFAVLLVALLRPSVWNIIFNHLLPALALAGAGHPRAGAEPQGAGFRPRRARRRRFGLAHPLSPHLPQRAAGRAALRRASASPTPSSAEASLSFLGFGDPNMISWGTMLYDTYLTGSISRAMVVDAAARPLHHALRRLRVFSSPATGSRSSIRSLPHEPPRHRAPRRPLR